MKNFAAYVLMVSILVLSSCAQVEPLSGGEKDIIPPRIVSSKVYPSSGTVNFNSEKIEINFDEFIVLKNANENIVITPSLKGEKPKYKIVNKRLIVDMKGVELDENTTYSINFNGAIQDFNEGNDSLYQYVFSTGSFLDSLTLSGKVEDAFQNNGVKDFSVLLYEDVTDSVIYKSKPKYFTRTNEKGGFQFSYLKPGTYKMVAIEDLNKSLTYDPIEEKLAFLKEKIVLDASGEISTPIRSFTEVDDRHFVKEYLYSAPGELVVTFSDSIDETDEITFLDADMILDSSALSTNEMTFWNKEFDSKRIKFIANIQGEIDTITRSFGQEKQFIHKIEPNIRGVINPFDTIRVSFSSMPKKIDLSKVQLLREDKFWDTAALKIVGNHIVLSGPIEPAKDFTMILNEGVFTSIHDSLSPQDTLRFTTRREEYYGNLFITTNIDKSGFYELVNSKGDVVFTSFEKKKFEVHHLAPGNYSLRFIRDENNNRVWDVGNYQLKTQPEFIIYMDDPIVVRSNWDVEMEWKYE